MSPNPFLVVDDALKSQVEEITERLQRLSGVLPAASQSDVDSHYAKASGLGVEETQRLLLERTGFVCIMARLLGWNGAPPTMAMVRDIHEGIFRPVFGDDTLGYRKAPDREEYRDDDGVKFPIWVADGPGRQPRVRVVHGVRASQVMRRVDETCAKFEKSSADDAGSSEDRALLLARLYVRLIRTHPFGDGNGRTAWAALQLAAGRVKFPLVQSTPTMEARLALGAAILDGRRIEALVGHINRAAWEGT